MITRKITYKGNFDKNAVSAIFDITRKIEITGEVRSTGPAQVDLLLEGDPSMIKLIQHQVERKVKSNITGKEVSQLPFSNFQGVTLLT